MIEILPNAIESIYTRPSSKYYGRSVSSVADRLCRSYERLVNIVIVA